MTGPGQLAPLIAIAAWLDNSAGGIAAVYTAGAETPDDEFFATFTPATDPTATPDPYDFLNDDEPEWIGQPHPYDNYPAMLHAFERWYFHHAGYTTSTVIAEDLTAGFARLFADLAAHVCPADPWSARHDTPHDVRTAMLLAGIRPGVSAAEQAERWGLTGEEYGGGPLHDARLITAVWRRLAVVPR